VRPAAGAALAFAIVATLAACGGESRAERTARVCAAAGSGERALHGSGDIATRVHAAEERVAAAARVLPQGDPEDPTDVNAAAVRVLLAQSLRLRLVRTQIARGAPPAQQVLEAAASGLTGGDAQVRDALAAAGVHC
jgi:hypothetical protein